MPNPVYQPVSGASGALPAGLEVEAQQQAGGAWRQDVTVHNSPTEKLQTEVVDIHGHIANVQAVTGTISGDEYGIITNAIVHGRSSAGGGAWVDVKVTPSGAMTTDSTISSSVLPTGAATYAAQTDGTQKAQIVSPTGTAANVTARTQTPSGNALQVQIGPADVVNDITPVVLDWEHHQLHEGETWLAQDVQTSLGTNTVKYAFIVPTFSTAYNPPHLVLAVDTYNENVLVQVYEGATYTGGSTVTPYNKNRNIAASPSASVKTGVTSTNGTLIFSFFAGGSAKSTSDANRVSQEWVMKSNTTYRIDVIGKDANGQAIVSFDWYEDQGV